MTPVFLSLVANFGAVCGGIVGMIRSAVSWGAPAAIAPVSYSFLIYFLLCRVGVLLFFCRAAFARGFTNRGGDYFFGCAE